MSVKRRLKFYSGIRLDIPHIRSLESSVSYDFDSALRGVITGITSPYVVRGFDFINATGLQASNFQINVANSVILHSTASESGTILEVPSTESTQTINALNSKVIGSFQNGVINYVALDYRRVTDEESIDQTAGWSPSEKLEFQRTVPISSVLEYRFVVTTDVKDVYFQLDPFDYIEKSMPPGSTTKLIIASEGLRYKDEPWGDENLKQAYGSYVYEEFKNNTIYNVGTFGGVSEYVKDMVFNIFTNAINRPIPICDQAVFNVLIGTQPFKDICYPCDDWACEAGTVADPTKIDKFRPNLLCYEPVFEDGIVYTQNKSIFPIVHQYDRVPEWKNYYMEKYEQEDESQYFVYKV